MVDESIDIAERFPVPGRGVPAVCALNFDAELPIPLIYFGRETRASGRVIPESPEQPRVQESSSRRISNNPLNSIIRKWETQFAIQGGVMESSDYVATKGRTDDRYYHADEWLDDGEEEEGDSGEYIGEVDLDGFRVIVPGEVDEDHDEGESEDGTDQENEDDMEDVGGNWQLLIKRLDSSKQQTVKDIVVDLETFQAFPGHTKQKKQKHLRDTTARLRRLLPKINNVQSQWQAAVWNVVVATNDSVNMQAFMELWNDVAPIKQKEELVRERDETIVKLNDNISEVVSVWKRGEGIMRLRYELPMNLLSKIWDLWVQEEECAGRVTPLIFPNKSASKTEKRFATILSELVPQVTPDIVPLLLRVALFGSKKSASSVKTKGPDGSEEEGVPESHITLPTSVYIYRKNELLKCKLLEVKSLNHQQIQIIDKEWENFDPSSPPEFDSFDALFESYQQKYVRKQDRLSLASSLDAWKYFAFKNSAGEYITMYELVQKASAVLHYGIVDKIGGPLFLPQIATARAADAEKRKKQNDLKDERKRKREALESKAKELSMRNPPFNDTFMPFPDFDRDLFAMEKNDSIAPVVADPE